MDKSQSSAIIQGFIAGMQIALNQMTDDLRAVQAPDFPDFNHVDCGECKQCHTTPRLLFRRSGHGVLLRCAPCFIDFELYLERKWAKTAISKSQA